MTATESFHAWLIKHRVYCERCTDLIYAKVVRNFNGKDMVLCQTHADRLDAVRQSERKQDQIKSI